MGHILYHRPNNVLQFAYRFFRQKNKVKKEICGIDLKISKGKQRTKTDKKLPHKTQSSESLLSGWVLDEDVTEDSKSDLQEDNSDENLITKVYKSFRTTLGSIGAVASSRHTLPSIIVVQDLNIYSFLIFYEKLGIVRVIFIFINSWLLGRCHCSSIPEHHFLFLCGIEFYFTRQLSSKWG